MKVLLSFLLLMLGSMSAHAELCPNPMPARTNITLLDPPPLYNYSRSLQNLGTESPSQRRADLARFTHVLGLTQTQTGLSMQTQALPVRVVGGVCLHLQKADISFGFQAMVVSIIKEIPVNSCGFQHIKTHELRHVQAHRAALHQAYRRLSALMARVDRAGLAGFGTSEAAASEDLKKKLQDILQTAIEDYKSQAEPLNAAIDTPEEYGKGTTVCGGELQRIVRQSLQAR